MIKLEVKELVQALDVLKSTSSDTHVGVTQDGHSLHMTFTNADGELVTVQLFHSDSREMAKITRTERLAHVRTK